jgi:putative oxidoreductase
MKEIIGHLLFAATRVFVGLSMALAHGMGKIPPAEGLIGALASKGIPAAVVVAWAVAFIEMLGGIFLAIGLFSRIMGLLWVIVMGGAAFIMHATDPFSTQEKALLYLAFGVLYLAHGGGRYAVDTLIKRSKA